MLNVEIGMLNVEIGIWNLECRDPRFELRDSRFDIQDSLESVFTGSGSEWVVSQAIFRLVVGIFGVKKLVLADLGLRWREYLRTDWPIGQFELLIRKHLE